MAQQECADRLRTWLPPKSTVYTVVKSVSTSGMRREIGVCIVEPERHSILCPVYAIAQVLDLRIGQRGGLIVRGCGMDMGFHLVHGLACALYDDGYALHHEWI